MEQRHNPVALRFSALRSTKVEKPISCHFFLAQSRSEPGFANRRTARMKFKSYLTASCTDLACWRLSLWGGQHTIRLEAKPAIRTRLLARPSSKYKMIHSLSLRQVSVARTHFHFL